MSEWICNDCLNNLEYEPEIKTIPNIAQVSCFFCEKLAEYLIILKVRKWINLKNC